MGDYYRPPHSSHDGSPASPSHGRYEQWWDDNRGWEQHGREREYRNWERREGARRERLAREEALRADLRRQYIATLDRIRYEELCAVEARNRSRAHRASWWVPECYHRRPGIA